MNNLRYLLILSSLASLLVTAPNLVPVQSYASAAAAVGDNGDYKITKDYKDSIHKDINSKSDSTNQHSSQDNLCYRDDGCEQANEGGQTKGKDNAAEGFNDQSKNIEQQSAVSTTPSSQTPGNGTTPIPTPTPTPTTSSLTVTKHVVCDFTPSSAVACPTADEFNITATTGNGSSLSFNGFESGTPLTINPPFPVSYQVTETDAPQGFVIDTIPVGNSPRDVAFNPNNGLLYVTNQDSNTVSVIDGTTNTVVGTPIPVGNSPRGVAFNPNNGFMYVTNFFGNTVTVIDGATNTVVGSPIPVGSLPIGVAFNPNNGFMYVTNLNSNTVTVIDGATNTVVGSPIPVGSRPFGVAFNPDNGDLYVANQGSNTVSVIDGTTNTVTATIPVGSAPSGIAFNPDNGDLYVANQGSNTVSVIDGTTNTVTATIPVGSAPVGIAFNPNNGNLYVANAGSNTVTVIDGATNTVVGSPIPVGSTPIGVAFNPNNGFVYVANSGSNTVSVIAPLTTTFSEGCNGTISNAGQTVTCTVTNAYGRPA